MTCAAALREAIAAFDAIPEAEADAMTFAARVRRAVEGTDCTFEELTAALIAEEGAKA